ncbi:MAG: UPF0149 family protein [Porticoccaceae bacterium]|nr:UPF0149 family protein [Porticoccaceae bacterium]
MTFKELALCLEVEGFQETPSEMHGLLCGRIAGGERLSGDKLAQALIESLDSDEELVANALVSLEQLYASIVAAFESADLSFKVLLPDEDWPLADRVMALSDWCQYFLSGLGDSGLRGEANLSADVKDAIGDLAAIARVGYEGDGEEDDEADLFELEEFVRMAAMLIFAELNISHLATTAARPPSQTLH